MNFRTLVKRGKFNRAIIMVDHPETGELVEWRNLDINTKYLCLRKYFKDNFDEAFNDIVFSLQDPSNNKDEDDILKMTQAVGKKFLEHLVGFDSTKSWNMDRNGYKPIVRTSSITNEALKS